MNPRIYLAGTISEDERTFQWRKDATALLEMYSIEAIDPMRNVDLGSLANEGLCANIPQETYFARDLSDISRCCAMIVNLLYADSINRPSIGTYFEIGYAYAYGIPVVVISDDPSTISHPFIRLPAMGIVETLEEAIDLIVFYLS